MTEQEIKQLVKEYQKTRDEEIFNKLYLQLKGLIFSRISKHGGYILDLSSDLHDTLFHCILNYDEKKNNKFTAYLNTYLNFTISGRNAEKYLAKNGGYIEEGEDSKTGKRNVKTLSLEFEYSRTKGVLGDFVEDKTDYYETSELRMIIENAFNNVNLNDKEKILIQGILDDKKQKDIGKEIGVVQERVNHMIKDLLKKYPQVREYLEEATGLTYTRSRR